MANLKDGDTIKAGHTVLTVSLPSTMDGSAPNDNPPTETYREKPEVLPSNSQLGDSFVPESFPVIPGYEIVRFLGRGGMGTIYEAQRKSDKARLALKTIVPAVTGTPVLVQRFLREARILCLLNHPNIVSFRDMGESQGMLYFAMDYVEGTDAARMLKEKGPLPVRKAVRLITQVLAALVYAHQRGFVHRDIKPSNILVESSGRKKSVRVADFGLARIYLGSKLSGLTMQGEIGGTFAFMAPEQATHFRQTKPPADQYAAAATLYNLLTDRFLYDFTEGGVAALVVILTKETIPIEQRRPDLPPGLARVIGRATARRPEDRFPDVQAFRQELLPFGR
jgi:serine/threonine-protein kinase